MSYGVIRTDLMHGTDVGAELRSLEYFVSTTPTAIENGNIVKLDSLISGEREVWKAVTPAAADALDDCVIVATPEVLYDERLHNLDEFRNEAGTIARGYKLHKGDIFSVTADCINNNKSGSAALAVGDVIELYAGTKLQAVASLTASSTQVGSIIAIETAGSYTYYVIKVA